MTYNPKKKRKTNKDIDYNNSSRLWELPSSTLGRGVLLGVLGGDVQALTDSASTFLASFGFASSFFYILSQKALEALFWVFDWLFV